MKIIRTLICLAIATLLSAKASAADSPAPAGKVHFKMTALTQLADAVTLKTNKTSTGTNIIRTVKSTVHTATLVNKDILRLLVNSLTNLPTTVVTNGHLQIDNDGNFFIVTATTTNDVSSVLSYQTGEWVVSGSETTKTKTPPGTLTSEVETLTTTQSVEVNYDDFGLDTRDGTQTSFEISGILVNHFGDRDRTPKFTQSLSMTGAGDGTIKDEWVVIKSSSMSGDLKTTDFDDLVVH